MIEHTTQLIGEMLPRQRRYSRKEKEAFLRFLESRLDTLGINHRRTVITGMLRHIHLEAGSDRPRVVLLAHYDTQTMLPFWFEWLVRVFGHTRTLLSLAVFYALVYAYSLLGDSAAARITEVVFVLSLLPMLVPSRHTMNDNTSGVIALLSVAWRMSRDPVLMSNVRLVFTDNEEKMLAGSMALRRIWKRSGFDYRRMKIISVDSIGRGSVPVISYNFNSSIAAELKKTFETTMGGARTVDMWLTPFSDAYPFSLQGAVNINMMDRSFIPGGFFIRNIHSPLDRKISGGNIAAVADTICRYCSDTTATGA